jgi:hypothetical protein
MVENAVNATHGIHGRPIKFIVSDDQSSPQVAVQLLTGILQKTPPVVIGSSLVAACKAMAPLMQSGPTLYCLSGTYEPPAGSKIFAYGIPATNIMRFHLRYFREHRVRRVAAIVTTDATGQDGERAIRQAMALAREFRPLTRRCRALQSVRRVRHRADVQHQGGQSRFADRLRRGHAARHDSRSTQSARTQRPHLDIRGKFQRTSDGATRGDDAGGRLLHGCRSGLVPSAATSAPLKRAIQTYLTEKAKPGIHAEAQSIIGWDSAMISSTILRGIGNAPTGDQFAAALHALHDYYGAAGAYDFRDSQTGLNENSAVMVR